MDQNASAHPKKKGKSKKKNSNKGIEDTPAEDEAVSQSEKETAGSITAAPNTENPVTSTEGQIEDLEIDGLTAPGTAHSPEYADTNGVRGSNAMDDLDPISNDTRDDQVEKATHPEFMITTADLNDKIDTTWKAKIERLECRIAELEETHTLQVAELDGRLSQALDDNQQLDDKYRGLLGKVATIRTTLGDRLKQDAEELADCKATIELLQEQNNASTERNRELEGSLIAAYREKADIAKEASGLRDRLNFSQQNWAREREELETSENYIREEYEIVKKSMQDWEVLAMEESSVKKALRERCDDLEEQLATQKEAYDFMCSQREKESSTIEGLQRALEDIQTARKKEFREYVASSQTELEGLREEKTSLQSRLQMIETKLVTTQSQLHENLHFETEVKEKSLLIGKLRHEAVILNEHLTKALRMLQKAKPQDNVDRQLITNLMLKFLAFPRGDAKKYEVLQLIASFLNWTDEQRESAGLARPGTSSGASSVGTMNRSPLPTPFRRTASNHTLGSESPNVNKESLAELWTAFLDHEADQESNKSPKDL